MYHLRCDLFTEEWQRKVLSVPPSRREESKRSQLPSFLALTKAFKSSRSSDCRQAMKHALGAATVFGMKDHMANESVSSVTLVTRGTVGASRDKPNVGTCTHHPLPEGGAASYRFQVGVRITTEMVIRVWLCWATWTMLAYVLIATLRLMHLPAMAKNVLNDLSQRELEISLAVWVFTTRRVATRMGPPWMAMLFLTAEYATNPDSFIESVADMSEKYS